MSVKLTLFWDWDMKPEILLKAFVQYQSEDAFRDIVAGTLDAVYSTSHRIAHGTPHLAEEITLSAYAELAHQAPRLGKDVELASWLNKCACKMAVKILRAENRPIDWAALKKEKDAHSIPDDLHPAPPGLAIRIGQSLFLSAARHKRHGLFSPPFWEPVRIRPWHVGAVAVCALVLIAWWCTASRQHHPIIQSQGSLMTPSSFAQLASPEEGAPPKANRMVSTNAGTNLNQK